MLNSDALKIGRTIRDARLGQGYNSRASLVETKALAGKLSGEGLRKIEEGERIPRLETLRDLCRALKLKRETVEELENLAVRQYVERAARRAGNAEIDITINGDPMRVHRLPPHRKTEAFVRAVVSELVDKAVGKYGVMDQDVEHFRRVARATLHRHLSEGASNAA